MKVKKMREKNKRILNASVIIMLVVSAITAFAGSALSDSYETQADWDNDATIWLEASGLTNGKVELGDTFDITIYIDTGANDCDVWAIRNITYNSPNAFRVNVTPVGNPAPNINVSFQGVWNVPLYADATLDNTAGVLSSIGSYYGTGTSGNNSACLINFTALNCGLVWINQSFNHSDTQVYIRDGTEDFTINTQNNISVLVTPQDPASILAVAWNQTQINLSWTKGTGGDNVTLCGKAGSYPTGPSDSVIYNGSALLYADTGLTNCTDYYYRIWSYNTTTGITSATYRQTIEKTKCPTNFSYAGETPADNTQRANCTSYNVPINVTVINSGGHNYNYWINTSNGDTWSGTGRTANTSTPLHTMSGLSHGTTYWWNVTVADGNDDYLNASYNFTTGWGGGTAPAGGAISPISASTSVDPLLNLFSVGVTDADGDDLNVTFFWGNDTVIGYDDNTPTAGTAQITPGLNLVTNTTYYWHAEINDSCQTTRYPAGAAEFFFTTDAKAITMSKTMNVHTNNTIEVWINLSNTGEINMTNVWLNETYDSDVIFLGANPVNESGDNTTWIIPYLNMTGCENHWYNITIWLNVSWPLANGSTITNTAEVQSGPYTNSVTATPLTHCLYASKEANMTFLEWNTDAVTFFINITNCGDFYLNSVIINDTYDANYTYASSNIAPNETNERFNITSINPGATFTLFVNVTTSVGGGNPLVNASYHYNNITLTSNETDPEITKNTYLIVGARTESIRIIYISQLTSVSQIADSVVAILGILMVIGAILLIILVVRKGGDF